MIGFEPGMVFANRFEIERIAGSGGMGDVFRARDRYTGEPVALKLLQPQGASSHAVERFTREARLLSEVRHDGIVAYVAHGRAPDGRDFLAMEWLEGEDLAARLALGPLGLAESVTLVRRVAEALAVAHAKGVIHRDLKPANVFLPRGDLAAAKLLDFGVARRVVASRAMTAAGLVVGTPDYMAPEQARGDHEITPSADVFSLGCVLYECLAGHPPFMGDHVAAVLARILFEDPPSIEARRPGIPPPLAALLHRMLAKYPAERLADASELCAALATLGDIPELPFAPTLVGAVVPLFGEDEQHLMSLVFASSPSRSRGDGTVAEADEIADIESRRALASALESAGARADFLADGSLLVTVPAVESAIDQAAHAARAALVVKERWPEADVALCTGRGRVRGRLPFGDVVDQAVRLLGSRETPAQPVEGAPPLAGAPAPSAPPPFAGRPPGVRVDKLTAGLLKPRFALTPSPEGPLLVGEEIDADVTRLLLGKPTPCVGREAELGALEALLAASIDDSEARAVLVTAPPGTGKSRLRHELLRRVAHRERTVTVMLGRADAMNAGAPHAILRAALEQVAGLDRGEPPDEQRARFEARIARSAPEKDQRRIVELLGEVCGVPFPAEASVLLRSARSDPKVMHDQIQRAFVDWLRAETAAAPVLLVLDDLQWADGLTVALVDRALRELSGAPLFVLALARPEVHDAFPKLWHGRNVQPIALKSLGKKACERLVRDVLGPRAPAVAARIAEQSAGNALFLEELIRAEAEGLTGAQPETVVAMLQARIGRFEAGPRRALRAASVFGHTFRRGGVAALLGAHGAPRDVDDWLDELVSAEVVEPLAASRSRDDRELGFRHALVRDAAYGLLTPSDLVAGHRLAGAYLADHGEEDPIAIADHFERGDDEPRAVAFYVRAAELAMESRALDTAARCAERGIACGAEGEPLGVLHAIQGSIGFWRVQVGPCLAGAEAALPLLRPGSRAWTWIAWPAAFMAASGSREWRARAPALIQEVLLCEPEPDARSAHAEALFWITYLMILLRPDAEVRAALGRMAAIAAQANQEESAMERWLQTTRLHVAWWLEPRPWKVATQGERVLELCNRAGDIRLQTLASVAMETSWAELGDAERAVARLRPLLKLPGLGQDNLLRWLVVQYVAWVLIQRRDEASLDEAEQLLVEILASGLSPGFAPSFALATLARVKLLRGQPAGAEARRAHAVVQHGPRGGAIAIAPLVRVLLAEGRPAEAAEIAARGIDILREYAVGHQEIELRLAASEAFHAAGDVERARGEITETLRRIEVRCDDIADPAWRDRYLNDNPDNVRARRLASEWGIAPGSAKLAR